MPSFTNFSRGTLVTATFLNQIEKGLYWLQEDLLRLAIEAALTGIAPSYVSLWYDLFADTSEFDSAAVTPDMAIDTANGVIKLPTGFSINTDYYYQSILHTMPATVTKANMLLSREDIANTTVYPSLSCVGTGLAASFTEKTTPISSRNVNSAIDQWDESFTTTGNSGAYTVNFDTTNGKINLPGSAAGNFSTPVQVTSNAVADAINIAPDTTNPGHMVASKGVASEYDSSGNLVVIYNSKEANASFRNVRLRKYNSAGVAQTWGANAYIDVTAAAANHDGPMLALSQDGLTAAVLSSDGNQVQYRTVNLTSGAVSAATSLGAAGVPITYAIAREFASDNVFVMTASGASHYLYRFAIGSPSAGSPLQSAVSLGSTNASPRGINIGCDQEGDMHFVYRDGSDRLRYNIWDTSAGAYLYTLGTNDKQITVTSASSRVNDQYMLVDPTQSGSNKKAWITYAKDASGIASVYYRDITNGTVGSEITIKTHASKEHRNPQLIRDGSHTTLRFTYWNSTDGLLTNTYTDAAVLGTEQVVDASALQADGWFARTTDSTKVCIAYRRGTNNDTASELYYATKNLGYPYEAKTWQSVLRTLTTTATKFYVAATVTTPTNTTAVWQITADNGGTWNTVTLGSTGTFTVPGMQIILKVTLQTTDAAATPEVEDVTWKAILPLIEEEFEWTGLSGVDMKIKLRGRSSNASFNPKAHSVGVIVS